MAASPEKIALVLEFDPAALCAAAGFADPGGETLAFAATCADALASGLEAWRIADPARAGGPNGPDGFLLLAVAAGIEAEFSETFARSPSRGYLAQTLAAQVLTRAAAQLMPELAALGCAPFLAPSPPVREAMSSLGVDWLEPGGLSRALAALTPMPYRGGCEVCLLAGSCPRLRGGKPERDAQKKWFL
ncbi:MAG: hypothetical protein HQK81_05260 [Desulfovibrionaceae bacterium]|nr:hypothetical protein [Desulfovibrionaceae bacterium]